MYTETELKAIRDTIAGKNHLNREEIQRVCNRFPRKEDVPKHLLTLIELFPKDPDLFAKLSADERVKEFNFYGFFPEVFGLVYGSEVNPEIVGIRSNRGAIVRVNHPKKDLIIKGIQNAREPEIARIAGELGVGPRQYESLDGFLTEDFIEGVLFPRLPQEETTPERMYELGRRFGEVLSKLHNARIYYNDTSLADDFRGSHYVVPQRKSTKNNGVEIISPGAPAMLIDYGVSIRLNRFPNLSDEEVMLWLRTKPALNFLIEAGTLSDDDISRLIEENRRELATMAAEEVMTRDLMFMNEGISFASYRLGNHITDPFMDGFNNGYKRKEKEIIDMGSRP